MEAAFPQPVPVGRPEVRDQQLPGWSATPDNEALEAMRALLARRKWRTAEGNKLRAYLRSHLDSTKWVYCYLSTTAIHLIYADTDEFLIQVEQRLATEPDRLISMTLVHRLYCFLDERAEAVDQIFARLAALKTTPYLANPDLGTSRLHETLPGAVVQCLTILAAHFNTPFAGATIRSWLTSPIENSATVTMIAGRLRLTLNPADPSRRSAQNRAFELLTLAGEPTRTAWTEPATAQDALRVADSIATEVYHVSGAFVADGKPARELGDPAVFAELALPLLEHLRSVRHPAVTHHIIQTAEHLGSSLPKQALLLAMQTATDDPNYSNESLGLGATLRLIRRYIADHRDLVLGDPECRAAVRLLLEHFVRVGWHEAIRMSERIDDLFL